VEADIFYLLYLLPRLGLICTPKLYPLFSYPHTSLSSYKVTSLSTACHPLLPDPFYRPVIRPQAAPPQRARPSRLLSKARPCAALSCVTWPFLWFFCLVYDDVTPRRLTVGPQRRPPRFSKFSPYFFLYRCSLWHVSRCSSPALLFVSSPPHSTPYVSVPPVFFCSLHELYLSRTFFPFF